MQNRRPYSSIPVEDANKLANEFTDKLAEKLKALLTCKKIPDFLVLINEINSLRQPDPGIFNFNTHPDFCANSPDLLLHKQLCHFFKKATDQDLVIYLERLHLAQLVDSGLKSKIQIERMRDIIFNELHARKYPELSASRHQKSKVKHEFLAAIEKKFHDFSLLMQNVALPLQKRLLEIHIEAITDLNHLDICGLMTKKLPIATLTETINTCYPDVKERNQFKRKLCSYMVNNTNEIVTAQTTLTLSTQNKLSAEETKLTEVVTPDLVAKNVLLTIKDLILSTDWNVGLFGGTPAPGQPDKKIPHRMATILSIINKHEAQSADLQSSVMIWKGACTLVANAAKDAINNKGLSFFGLVGKRSKDTKEHYLQFVKLTIKAG